MPSAWSAVLANVAATVCRPRRRAAAAGRHRQGPDASAGRVHRRARPVRRLQLVDRPAGPRPRPPAASPTARRSRSSASAEGLRRRCAGSSRGRSSRSIELREVKQIGFADADAHRREGAGAVRRRRVRRLHAVLFQFKSVIAQVPTARAAHPGRDRRRGARQAGGGAGLRIRAGRGDDPRRPAAAQPLGADLPGAAGERRLRAGRADDARWTTPRATPAT